MGKWLGLAAAGLVLAAILLMALPQPTPDPAPDPAQAACRTAQQAVRERLKTVATALFPSCHETSVTQTGIDSWKVEGRFDADFLFGENSRTGYVAQVRSQDGAFITTALKIWP